MERREQYRMLVDATAKVTFSDGASFEAKGIDVSQNGVLLQTHLNPRVGDRVSVALSLLGDESDMMPMEGEVVRVEKDQSEPGKYLVGCWVTGFSDFLGDDF
ncbi:MAG: PilZ domain-containing protein [Gammaproteobacteria bacterium]|nr:PilZ domain-containing protein [Gammaproteobacteria bacterium]